MYNASEGQGQQPGFCGMPGSDASALGQASWGHMDPAASQGMAGMPGMSAPQQHMPGMPVMGGGGGGMGGMGGGGMGMPGGDGGSMANAMVPGQQGMPEQASISLSAQAELELELSLRGSLLVQQQRRIVQLEDELQRAWAEIDRLRTKIAAAERDRQRTDDDSSKQPRYWTPDEHRLFMEAVQRYGWKDVKSIATHVGTRTPTQVRTHAQKLFLRQQKESSGIMAPAKNGREMPAVGVPGVEGGTSDQLQALQEAGYHLAEQAEGGGGEGEEGGEPAGMPPAAADLPAMANPDADPSLGAAASEDVAPKCE